MDQQDPESRQISLFSEHLGLKRTNQYESDILVSRFPKSCLVSSMEPGRGQLELLPFDEDSDAVELPWPGNTRGPCGRGWHWFWF
jgi:hypothetical protein